MIQARWLIIFFAVLGMSIPSFALDLTMGGFPSYMRTRVRYISNATLMSTLSDVQANALGSENADDEVFLVDTTLRLTPQLSLNDAVSIRAQVDVVSNSIWGGQTSGFFGDTVGETGDSVVLSDLRPNDRFRGAVLHGAKTVDPEFGYFNVRMLHADIVLPNNLGFVRVGRQPFDWGLGILANGGHDPKSDLGFVVDRLLWLKSFPTGEGTFTLVLVSDIFSNGSTILSGSGRGYDILAAAGIYNQQMGTVNVTIGAYGFPYLHQENVFSSAGGTFGWDADRTGLYAGLLVLKSENWTFTYEVQMFGGGELDTPLGEGGANLSLDLDYAFDMAARLELYTSMMSQMKSLMLEVGWAQGDDGTTPEIEGNALPFSPAYNIDNLLFKHIIPTVYNIEGSVINAFYGRLNANMVLSESVAFTPQILVAWNDQTDAVSAFDSGGFGTGIPNTSVDRYLGTEIEGTLTWTLYPGVDLDFMGSIVVSGSGLDDLITAHGNAEADRLAALDPAVGSGDIESSYDGTPWAIQTRLLISIDQFMN